MFKLSLSFLLLCCKKQEQTLAQVVYIWRKRDVQLPFMPLISKCRSQQLIRKTICILLALWTFYPDMSAEIFWSLPVAPLWPHGLHTLRLSANISTSMPPELTILYHSVGVISAHSSHTCWPVDTYSVYWQAVLTHSFQQHNTFMKCLNHQSLH